MAHLAPTIPFTSHADGTQAAVRQWLDALTHTLQAGALTRRAPRHAPGDEAARLARLEARARILQQAGANMLAPIEGQPRAASHLLR